MRRCSTLVHALLLAVVCCLAVVASPASAGAPSPTPALNMIPEGNANNVNLSTPAANLWICTTGDCAGPGEGNLIVFQYASGISTGDMDSDGVTDGLGAHEFSVDFDNFVISSVNPTDVGFNPGPLTPHPDGGDGVTDGEGAARGPSNCAFSIVAEAGYLRFGCVTAGAVPGPTGDLDIARLNLVPHADLADDLLPDNGNGILTSVSNYNCELVDVFGHPVQGSINGGILPVCGDLAVTVRILEGDVNLDCVIDVADEQAIAYRYASAFGDALYDSWYDLEPHAQDLDIGVLDIEKVVAREGSTCQAPMQPQPPLTP